MRSGAEAVGQDNHGGFAHDTVGLPAYNLVFAPNAGIPVDLLPCFPTDCQYGGKMIECAV